MRLLTEFKREDRLLGKFDFEDDELARQLGLGEFIGRDTENIERGVCEKYHVPQSVDNGAAQMLSPSGRVSSPS